MDKETRKLLREVQKRYCELYPGECVDRDRLKALVKSYHAEEKQRQKQMLQALRNHIANRT